MAARRFFLASVFLVLAGCGGGGHPAGLALREAPEGRGFLSSLIPGSRQPDISETRALAKARLARGDIVLSGPDGYCVDAESLRSTAGNSFALIASCATLTENPAAPAVQPLLFTVTIGPRSAQVLPDASALAAAVGSTPMTSTEDGGVVIVHLATGGDVRLPEGDARHWRGVARVNNRLVGIALYAPRGAAAAGAAGGPLVAEVLARVLRDSPAATPIAPVASSAPDEQAPTAAVSKPLAGGLGAVWSRLTGR